MSTDKNTSMHSGGVQGSNWSLIKRLLAMASKYRWGCIRVLALQIVLLTLGLLGLGFMGLGVDYIRYALATRPDASRPQESAAASAESRMPAAQALPNQASFKKGSNIPVGTPLRGVRGRLGEPSLPVPGNSPLLNRTPHLVDTAKAHPPAADASAGTPSGTGLTQAKPPIWPFGLEPPADWPPMTVVAAISGSILLFALLRSLLNILYTIASNNLIQGRIVVDLRAKVYDTMQRLSFRFFDANASSSIINRVTGDVQAVRMFVDGVLMQVIIMMLSLSVYLVYMLRIHPGLTLACLASTPLLWYMTSRFSRTVQPAYLKNRDLFDRLILMFSENFRGADIVKVFGLQQKQIQHFTELNHELRDHKLWIFGKVAAFQPLIGSLTQMNLMVMLAYGGYLTVCYEHAPDQETARRVGLSVGQLLVFAGLLQQFSGQVANIANVANSMQQSLASARRVFEVLDTPVDIKSPPDAVRLHSAKGAVKFEHVNFSYNGGEPVLTGIDFAVEPGQCVAILGATGSGKSTLLSLIPRFYDPASGRILVDGVDIRQLDVGDLRRNVGLVFQESFLFSNTVAANIAFGRPDATRERIEQAARIAAAHDFIMRMPDGYETLVHEGGSNLSGGQRQRLAIARAMLLEPPILLLDDPTASVDPETEDDILEAMDRAMKGRTTFLVAHRLSALRRADRVIVLEGSRIVQDGTHKELIRTRGHYLSAMQSQAPDEESVRLLGGNAEQILSGIVDD